MLVRFSATQQKDNLMYMWRKLPVCMNKRAVKGMIHVCCTWMITVHMVDTWPYCFVCVRFLFLFSIPAYLTIDLMPRILPFFTCRVSHHCSHAAYLTIVLIHVTYSPFFSHAAYLTIVYMLCISPLFISLHSLPFLSHKQDIKITNQNQPSNKRRPSSPENNIVH